MQIQKRRTPVLMATAALMVGGAALLWAMSGGDGSTQRAVPDGGTHLVTVPETSVAAAPTPTPAVPMTEPVPVDNFMPSEDMLKALALPRDAVFRGAKLYDASNGVTCGEVSQNKSSRHFRAFVYIANSKAGFVDDDGPMFKQMASAACAVR